MPALLEQTGRGLYCAQADCFIDPWKPVTHAFITHAHADHARAGMENYYATPGTIAILRHRLGPNLNYHPVSYGDTRQRNGVSFSFHPAGHVPGSAQIRVSHRGEIWVAAGDYKIEPDQTSTPFEPVPCHTFITESTFGLPIYQWAEPGQTAATINQWWRECRQAGQIALLYAYSLGKAQRLLAELDPTIGPIFTHPAVEAINHICREELAIPLPPAPRLPHPFARKEAEGALVIAPPAVHGSAWQRKLRPLSQAQASGWMAVRGNRRRMALDRGFVLSDHADWPGLQKAIRASGAETVLVTHGYINPMVRWLRENGWQANALATAYGSEEETSA